MKKSSKVSGRGQHAENPRTNAFVLSHFVPPHASFLDSQYSQTKTPESATSNKLQSRVASSLKGAQKYETWTHNRFQNVMNSHLPGAKVQSFLKRKYLKYPLYKADKTRRIPLEILFKRSENNIYI